MGFDTIEINLVIAIIGVKRKLDLIATMDFQTWIAFLAKMFFMDAMVLMDAMALGMKWLQWTQ